MDNVIGYDKDNDYRKIRWEAMRFLRELGLREDYDVFLREYVRKEVA